MADVSTNQIQRRFQLKPSRIARGFQLLSGLIILICLFQVLNIGLWIMSLIFLCIAYFLFLKQAQIQQVEQLDGLDWSIQCVNSTDIIRSQIVKIIDHRIYIVIYLADKKLKPVVIWQDQLALNHWKILKTTVKLA